MSERRSPHWMRRVWRACQAAFLAILLVALPLAAYVFFAERLHFVQNHESTTGTIIDRDFRCVGFTCHERVAVRFTDPAGRVVEFDDYSHDVNEGIGESVTVYYDSGNPKDADLSNGWLPGDAFLVAALVALWLGVAGYVIGRLQRYCRKPESWAADVARRQRLGS